MSERIARRGGVHRRERGWRNAPRTTTTTSNRSCDLDGEPIEAEIDDRNSNAINNIGRRQQESYGASVQLGLQSAASAARMISRWASPTARADPISIPMWRSRSLLENRSTSRTGIFAAGVRHGREQRGDQRQRVLRGHVELSEASPSQLRGRYDDTRIRLADRSGGSPELNGRP